MQMKASGSPDPVADPATVGLPPAGEHGRGARWRRILRTVGHFSLGYGALQAINVVVGLFLVRALSIEAYAQFGLATGFQITASNLMDLGFASTVIPLVGDRFNDRTVVGTYVQAARRLRTRAFLILAPFTTVAFVAIAWKHHWSWTLQVLLILPVLLALYSSGNVSCCSAPFFLQRRLREYYAPQTLSGLVRLVMYVILRIVGGLNAWTATALSALNITYIGAAFARKCRSWTDWTQRDTHATQREIVHYVLPALPALIFGALQAQISLFLISIFGQTTGIAQVAALNRIAQVFLVLQAFNVAIVEPYIARLRRERVLLVYLGLIVLVSVCFVPVVLLSFTFPGAILCLLGSKYEGLGDVVGWLVLASCINYVATLAWIMNRARKWIFWSGTILEIVLVLAVQIGFLIVVGVRTTREAVMFTLASSCCLVAAHAYNAVYGFLRGPRVLPGGQALDDATAG